MWKRIAISTLKRGSSCLNEQNRGLALRPLQLKRNETRKRNKINDGVIRVKNNEEKRIEMYIQKKKKRWRSVIALD